MVAYYDQLTKLWWGPENPPAFNPRASISDVIFYSLKRNPNNVAQINADDGVTLTFGQILINSIRIAENLRKIGLQKGNIVSLISRNNSDVASILFGSLMMGLSVSTLDPSFQTEDFHHMFKITKPKLIFCEPHNFGYVKQALTLVGVSPKIIIIGNDAQSDLPLKQLLQPVPHEAIYTPDIISHPESKIALIICSSGTTGLSKGVCLTHAQLISYTLRCWPLESHDVTMAFSSLYWITGVGTLLAGTVAGATRVITTQSFTPELQLDLIERYKLTVAFSPPSHIAQLIEYPRTKKADFSSVKQYVTGGSAVLEDLRKALSDLLPNGEVYVAYGMSELGSVATTNYPHLKAGSVGQPTFGAIFKVSQR